MTTKAGGGGLRAMPWRAIGWGSAAVLLAIPLVAGAPWTPSDYVFAATLFALVGGGLEFAARRRDPAFTLGAGIALLAALLLIWINAAVGIMGSEDDPANLMYAGVLAVGLVGIVVARGRAAGMVRAMAATAAAQALVALIALVGGLGAAEPPGRWGILVLNAVFIGLFAASAAVFRIAARR